MVLRFQVCSSTQVAPTRQIFCKSAVLLSALSTTVPTLLPSLTFPVVLVELHQVHKPTAVSLSTAVMSSSITRGYGVRITVSIPLDGPSTRLSTVSSSTATMLLPMDYLLNISRDFKRCGMEMAGVSTFINLRFRTTFLAKASGLKTARTGTPRIKFPTA